MLLLHFQGRLNICKDHFALESSKAGDVDKEILSLVTQTNSTQSERTSASDGTVNNNGRKNGIIIKLEESVGRSFQWLVCLLHAYELPFRNLFSEIDGGVTTGPRCSIGNTRHHLDFDAKDLLIKVFAAIP